ncbi:hypothetical protein P43SY_005489 [Pythium insidiosum]|uniref:Homeobox domain-containing protein n=1 Tax=Pythium insidiosum TaxID=114742 RepID=A0AAD5LBM0_PYTIN|nr:hypothetical protein P43SY_005489 [Pythium insidiosum]
MTLPNRANYTPGERRRERKVQPRPSIMTVGGHDALVNVNPPMHVHQAIDNASSSDGITGAQNQSRDDDTLRDELLEVLSSMSPDPTRACLDDASQNSVEQRVKELASHRALVETARQRLLDDPCLRTLPNRDELLMETGGSTEKDPRYLGESKAVDPMELMLKAQRERSRVQSTRTPGQTAASTLSDREWANLFHLPGIDHQQLLSGLDKLKQTDIASLPELDSALKMMPDGPVRGRYQRALNSANEYGKHRLYQQYRATALSRGLGAAAAAAAAGASAIENPLRQQPKKRANLSKHAKAVLRGWFEEHLHHPYPTEEEKDWLGMQGGITIEQVNNWFINTRGRKWKPMLTRLMAQKQAGGDCKLYDQMVEKIEEPYHRSPNGQ